MNFQSIVFWLRLITLPLDLGFPAGDHLLPRVGRSPDALRQKGPASISAWFSQPRYFECNAELTYLMML